MSISAPFDLLLRNNGFVRHSFNTYTKTSGYVRGVRNLTINGISYYNCAVVVGDWADNFISAEIYGYVGENTLREITKLVRQQFAVKILLETNPNANIEEFLLEYAINPAESFSA